MVKLKVKLSKGGMFYVPQEIRESFGRSMVLITNAKASVIYPEDTLFEDVLTSMEIIKADILHRITLRDRNRKEEVK